MRQARAKRLLLRKDYQLIYRRGKRYTGSCVVIFYRLNQEKKKRLGITIARKWGNAPERNRFKRVVRTAYLNLYQDLPERLDINIHPRQNYKTLKMQMVKRELQQFIENIGVNAQSKPKKSCRNDRGARPDFSGSGQR